MAPAWQFSSFAGIGSYKIKNDQLKFEDTRAGYSGGLGLEFGATPMISVEVRGRFLLIPTDGDGSRKQPRRLRALTTISGCKGENQMHKFIKTLRLTPVALIALLLTGCLLTGTFVVTVWYRNVDLTSATGFYYAMIDVTAEPDWEDHKDEIKDVDEVGFELWMTNNTAAANTVDVYAAAGAATLDGSSSKTDVQDDATLVLSLPLKAGVGTETFIGYAKSFSFIHNLAEFKKMAETGKFKFFAMSAATPVDFTIDSVKVVVTFTAGK